MNHQDFFFHKAKKEGYPARSVYKLQEIDRKYDLFKPGQFILDLGCAPGSWSLYICDRIGAKGRVLGIDQKEVDLSRENFIFWQSDVLKMEDRALSEMMMREGVDLFDGLVSDMAPSTSGIKSLDAGLSAELAERAFSLAELSLRKGGFLVLKILEGGEHDSVWSRIKGSFARAKQFRPKAVRSNSREIYVVADGFKRD